MVMDNSSWVFRFMRFEIKSMKDILFINLCLLLSLTIEAQVSETSNYPFKKAIFEASVMGNTQDDYEDVPGTGRKYRYYENSIHLGVLTNISKYWFVGVNYNYLWTRYKQQTVDNYFLTGVNIRYDRIVDENIRFYGDVLAEMGNYCSCIKDVRFDNMPYKVENSFYYGIGLGLAAKLNKTIWINVGFNRYKLVNRNYDSYGYAQLILGVQIHAF